jgi:nitrogen-specific signal transduction histidine kinase
MIENITERMELEERLRQSQKLEAVGRLAGGVAHDFNNLLKTINGVADLMMTEVPTAELRADLEEIRKAGARASSLTSQLLAFSRRQVLQPRVIDLNASIREMGTMLRRLIGENIDLALELQPDVHAVRADPGQIAQVLMNLAVNARDAMPVGGGLRISTSDVNVDMAQAARFGTSATGPHVLIEVSDTGHGMSEETRRNAFEPFFTTKEVGKGTGLGLATVYGIVKQSGGGIFIDSAPGRGATFRILLPAVDPSCLVGEVRPQTKAPAGSETVLIVEDEDAVRSLVSRVLRRGGYNVLEGRHGPDALRVSRKHHGYIDAVLTDVIMPGMSGPDLVKQLVNARPSLKVLYMSGYTQDEVLHYGVSQNTPGFIQKPMSPDALARKVREVLDAPV